MELHDAIHEGDCPRIIRCSKFMLLHWRHAGHTKYAHEVVHFVCAVQATSSTRLAHELVWCWTGNSHCGAGSNIPADLYLEHLNRTLKDYLNGVGPNISSNAIVQTSKSLKCLLDVTTNFARVCNIGLTSIHHTSASLKEDSDKIITQLTESRVFDYILGRFHHAFKGINYQASRVIPHRCREADTLDSSNKRKQC